MILSDSLSAIDGRLGGGPELSLGLIDARARFELSESVWGIPFGFGVWLKMLAGDGGQYGWRNIFPKICASG